MERHLISECDAVITVSNSIAAELRSRYGTLQTPVILMNCPEVSNDISPSTSFHRLLGLSDDEPILLYQGGYIKGRGLLTLIRAIEHIPKGHLVLMGWGKMEPELRALAASLGLLDRRVFFVSPVPQDELLRWTSTASVGVIPTQRVSLNNWYTLPNKLFEYIAAGLPVAASNFPEIRRVIEDYQVGCTFNPEDPEDIARAVQDVLVPHRFALFKKNTREAAKVFNWGVEETKLLELYSHLRF
jgi:glycosyltransferase involved in cell wall biosynthesis